MQQNNNLSVIPFYPSLDEQNHRKSYAFGRFYPLVMKTPRILPFQVLSEQTSIMIQSVELYKEDGTLLADITSDMTESGLSTASHDNFGVIIYTSIMPLSIAIAEGRYYLKITTDTEVWYSDVITFVTDLSGYIKLEWYDRENLEFDSGIIDYETSGFKNKLYLCTELGKPEYKFDEEGEERDGYFFPIKQISEKVYKCTALVPEYLCDVMRLIRMADYVHVTDQYGREYDCDTFLMTPKWQTQGDLASIEIEMETDTVVKKLAKGFAATYGDFNDDYNDDFLIS